MSNGGTVEELDKQVDALVAAVVAHKAVALDAEQHAITDPETWRAVAAVHRAIVVEHVEEIRLLRSEIALLPRPRGPVE